MPAERTYAVCWHLHRQVDGDRQPGPDGHHDEAIGRTIGPWRTTRGLKNFDAGSTRIRRRLLLRSSRRSTGAPASSRMPSTSAGPVWRSTLRISRRASRLVAPCSKWRRYDEAVTEFEYVLKAAPDNLTAVRELADIEQRRRCAAGQSRHACRRTERGSGAGAGRSDPVVAELEAWLSVLAEERVARAARI